jgi:hypothetical protein
MRELDLRQVTAVNQRLVRIEYKGSPRHGSLFVARRHSTLDNISAIGNFAL